jgi:hypothetical protein
MDARAHFTRLEAEAREAGVFQAVYLNMEVI